MNAYKVDFASRTITVTADFAKKMNDPKSGEYKTIARIIQDFPSMEIVHRSHRSPSSYTTKSGETYHCNQYKNLTYDHMERFIKALPNNDGYLVQFTILKDLVGFVQTSKYALVRRWFVKQFPLYRQNPLFYINPENLPNVVPFTEIQKESAKEVA